jgi:hypothetical protein
MSVAAALAAITPATQAPGAAAPQPPDPLTALITAIAFGPGNARVTKTVIVRVGRRCRGLCDAGLGSRAFDRAFAAGATEADQHNLPGHHLEYAGR